MIRFSQPPNREVIDSEALDGAFLMAFTEDFVVDHPGGHTFAHAAQNGFQGVTLESKRDAITRIPLVV